MYGVSICADHRLTSSGRDNQRAVVRALALVVDVLLPMRPASVSTAARRSIKGVVLENGSNVRIRRRHNRRFCARRQ